MNLIPGNRETTSRLPAFSLFPPEPVQTTGTVAEHRAQGAWAAADYPNVR